MSLCRFLSLVLVFVLAPVVSACASSPDTPFDEDGETATRTARGSSTLIVRAQLEQLTERNAYEAVATLNRRWLQSRRGASLTSGPAFARVVVDGVARGELDSLRQLIIGNIETMRYLSAANATTKYGTGFPGGVIEVTTRRN